MKELGEALKAARERVTLTRPQVALQLDLEPRAVQSWEVGQRTPSLPKLRELGRMYNLSDAELGVLVRMAKRGAE